MRQLEVAFNLHLDLWLDGLLIFLLLTFEAANNEVNIAEGDQEKNTEEMPVTELRRLEIVDMSQR